MPRAGPGSRTGPGTPEWAGLDCTPVRAGALFYWDPGIQVMAKVEGEFEASGPYCILFKIRQSAIRLGKKTVIT